MDKECIVNVHPPRPKRQVLTARQVTPDDDGGTQAVSIDSLNLEHCDFIKLDLEGAERLALEGARETIQKFRPFLLVEMNNLGQRFGFSDDSIKFYLIGLGYELVYVDGVDWGYMHSREKKKHAANK